jgi:hemophore-related protein
MALTATAASRVLLRVLGGGAVIVAAASLPGAAIAVAEPATRPPNCTAADLAGIASGVAAATSAYLFTHPDVNDFFTELHGRPNEEIPEATRAYFDANPQAHADLAGIRQPLVDFRARCGLSAPAPQGE